MKIDREINGDVAVLSLRGEFDSFVVNSYLEEVESLVANGITNVVLDMRLVKFIMSTAIGAIVKSRKIMKGIGGDLVISQPSGFVRDVLDSLGLTRVIKVFDENNLAIQNLGQSGEMALPAGNSVMLAFNDPARQSTIGKPVVGRIVELNEGGMGLQVAHPSSFFPASEKVKAKFRLPLFKKAYYFEIQSKIEEATPNEDGALVRISFTEAEEADRESIRQFLSDMNFLRDEVKKADQE